MNDREKWRERVRDIHACGTTWWWWWWWGGGGGGGYINTEHNVRKNNISIFGHTRTLNFFISSSPSLSCRATSRYSLILYHYPSLSSIAPGGSFMQHPESVQSCCRLVLAGHSIPVRVKGSTGVHRLWVPPYFSRSVPHVWFI